MSELAGDGPATRVAVAARRAVTENGQRPCKSRRGAYDDRISSGGGSANPEALNRRPMNLESPLE